MEPAGVGVDPVRREIQERSARYTETVRQHRRVASMGVAEVPDEQVWHGDDRREEREDETDHEERDDDYDDEDRQRRAHQEPDEHDGRDLDAAERSNGGEAGRKGVVLELLDVWVRFRSGHAFTFVSGFDV
jgi:hypothetical protein